MDITVYLSGEIHSDWREEIAAGIAEKGLPITLLSPVTDHTASDEVGVKILGAEEKAFWIDHKGAKINAMRSRTAIDRADVVVVKFGEQYKQWNAAFDAGYAVAKGKSTHLKIRASYHPHGDWKLRVRVGKKILAEQIVSYETVKEEWLNLDIDLSEFAGQNIELIVENGANDWNNEFGYWGSIKVVQE